MRSCVLAVLFVCPTIYCQNLSQPLTQVDACRAIKKAVVQVDTATVHGTGFIVDPNGWIVTAFHVVADQQTLVKYENITVSVLGSMHPIPAEIVSTIDNIARIRDFAILKINETKLPFLELGSEVNIEDGSPIAIVGFPLSAMFRIPPYPIPRFCLGGTVAAQTAAPLPKRNLQFLRTVYFQGVSVKGISGSPIVSLVTGKVIGIVSTKLSGITTGLDATRTLNRQAGPVIKISGPDGTIDVTDEISSLIDVLDNQLANGLGTGTGATDAAEALRRAKQNYKKAY